MARRGPNSTICAVRAAHGLRLFLHHDLLASGRAPRAAAQPPGGPARRLDDLVYPLVAQAEASGELTQGRALQVEPADGPVEFGPGHLRVAFGVDQPLLGADGFGQKLGVHLSTVTRRWTAAKR